MTNLMYRALHHSVVHDKERTVNIMNLIVRDKQKWNFIKPLLLLHHPPLFDECMLGVRANVFTTNELKGRGYHKEQSCLSTTGGHSVRAVVNVHVVNSEK